MIRQLLFVFVLFLYVSSLSSQDLVPIVKQYYKNDYNAGSQNWSVTQATDGKMCFGNNNGLLLFDGIRWSLYNLPQDKTARSVYAGSDGRIYVGSFEEFGYFTYAKGNQLVYHSLSDSLIDFKMKNDEVWTILELDDQICFQSFSSYFIYTPKNNALHAYRPGSNMFFFHKLNENIYTYDESKGYVQLSANKKQFVTAGYKGLLGRVVNAFALKSMPGSNLLVTQSNGLWLSKNSGVEKLVTKIDAELVRSEVNRAIITKDNIVILGTILNGVYALNLKGDLLWHINMDNVLQNNTVLGLFEDASGLIWLAMDKGIAKINPAENLNWLPNFHASVGAVYDLHFTGSNLYMATNQGLYKANLNLESKRITNVGLLQGVKGQVWDLSSYDNQLFCGSNDKTYLLNGSELSPISNVGGGMCIAKGEIHGKEVLVQGTYSSICIYLNENGKWKFSHTIPGFLNPVSHIEIDYTGRIWVSHMHKGMYLLNLDVDLKRIVSEQFFENLDGENPLAIRLFKLNNRVVFTDSRQFYTFDDLAKKIIPYVDLNRSLGYFASSHRICHFRDNLYWLIKDKEAGLFQVNASSTKLLDLVRFSNFDFKTVDTYLQFIPISENQCLITLENGLALYNFKQTNKGDHKVNLKLTEVKLQGDSKEKTEYLDFVNVSLPSVAFHLNNLTLSWFYPDFDQSEDVLYTYTLDGMDDRWSEPAYVGFKNYNYLPSGKYNFKLKALTFDGKLLSEMSFPFVVLEPFYWTVWAKIIYVLLFMFVMWLLYQYFKRKYHQKHERQRAEQEVVQKREIEIREQQITVLEKEKLEAELTLKSKELAQSTMTIINKNEILSQLRDELNEQKLKLGNQYPKKYFDKLMSIINENLTSEDDWNRFQSNFDMIHQNFFRHLHRDYPELTPNDLRFCAYLRLNLTSKDIANLMNITIKGVEVARYRIRKKINLPSSKSLAEFMIEYK